MKTGIDLVELAKTIMQQDSDAEDFLASTKKMELTTTDDKKVEINVPQDQTPDRTFSVSDHTHNQIAQRVGIPTRYYRRMLDEAPELLIDNVHNWFNDKPEVRLVRTLNGNARAFLSDRYKPIDNAKIANTALPTLVDGNSGLKILSCDVTDKKMYIQARFPKIEGEVKVNDPVQAGLIISNSEIGAGSLSIVPMVYRLICTNGMVSGTSIENGRLKKTHLGSRLEADENYNVYTDETRKAEDHALMLKIRDSIKALSDPKLFQVLMEQMRNAANTEKVIKPTKATEVLTKSFNLSAGEGDSFLENFIRDQDYTKWGALNAVTSIANSTDSYDRAVELEELGGRILTLSDREWHKIATAV